jgi:hypothetical protein
LFVCPSKNGFWGGFWHHHHDEARRNGGAEFDVKERGAPNVIGAPMSFMSSAAPKGAIIMVDDFLVTMTF